MIDIRTRSRLLTILFTCLVFTAYGQSEVQVSGLRFINEFRIEDNQPFNGTLIGGLSGIDYDPDLNIYYLLSDHETPRYYTASILISRTGIDSVRFLQSYSIPWSNERTTAEPDPEAIRLDRRTGQLVWTNEGEKISSKNIFLAPSINVIDTDGRAYERFSAPENLIMNPSEYGPRRNGTLEGLTFSDDFKTIYTSLEEPLYQDGPRASLSGSNSWVRFYQYNALTGENTAQYAYSLEPVAHEPTPDNAFKMNGISEILSLGGKKMLVIERSYSTGHPGCTIRLFIADFSSAIDVKAITSLKESPPVAPGVKKLVLNMESLGIYIDNIEGVTFGPDLPNGHKSLIFISDNNFNKTQKTQFLLFEVIP